MSETNQVKVWRMPDLHGAELLRGSYVSHTYPWHAHAEMSLGIVMEGAVRLRTRAEEKVAKAGSFVLINAEEAHQGANATHAGWRCRTIHIAPSFIETVALELGTPKTFGRPIFASPAFEDADLATDLHYLHRVSERGNSPLEHQACLLSMVSKLLARHATWRISDRVFGNEPVAVKRARDFLDANMPDKITLETLASSTNLSPFRLLRAFQATVGLTPQAYQTQARVRVARDMIANDISLAEAAAAVGFCDQAHLTRVFRGIMGVTPGQYRSAVC